MNSIDEYLDVSKLPSISLLERNRFPEIPCVYFVIDGDNTIYYVGGTTHLLNRWANHQKYSQSMKLKQPRVAYLKLSPYLIWDAEAFLIRRFKPPFNISIPNESELVNAKTL